MRFQITHAFAAAVVVLAPTRIAADDLVAQPQSRIWVEGTSTIKAFECKVPEFTISVKGTGAGAVSEVLAGEKGVRTVELSVPAAKIECGNGTMNEHMRTALKVKENPTISFALASYDVAKGPSGVKGSMRGSLALGGAKHPIDISAVATDAGNGAMRIVGGYEVALSAYDLKRPSLMFGRIKVGDKVQVKFDFVFKS
ncbi:MAG: YceI family protein [Gemmatimonadaceae bacterium]|nr:YceI family protein [Gemmatimonadaceae bacterium]